MESSSETQRNLQNPSQDLLGGRDPLNSGLGNEDYLEILNNTDTKAYMKSMTVEEFIGRLGQLAAKAAIGGETVDAEIASWDEDSSYLEETRPAKIRRTMWGTDLPNFVEELEVFWDDIAHIAGYRAADENYREAFNDNGILSRGSEQLWIDYGMDDYEQDAIREIT